MVFYLQSASLSSGEWHHSPHARSCHGANCRASICEYLRQARTKLLHRAISTNICMLWAAHAVQNGIGGRMGRWFVQSLLYHIFA